MIGVLALGGLYLYLRDDDDMKKPDTSGRSGDEPSLPPKPLPVEGDDYRVEMVAQGEQNEIQLLESRRGILYDDGSGSQTWESSGYLRGNLADGFVRASASVGGTITFTINDRKYENVLVYSSEEAALKADEKEEPKPDDPQKQPEEEDEPTQPSLPTRPDFGGGLGGGYTPFGGGF
jgi:hypothetical protein